MTIVGKEAEDYLQYRFSSRRRQLQQQTSNVQPQFRPPLQAPVQVRPQTLQINNALALPNSAQMLQQIQQATIKSLLTLQQRQQAALPTLQMPQQIQQATIKSLLTLQQRQQAALPTPQTLQQRQQAMNAQLQLLRQTFQQPPAQLQASQATQPPQATQAVQLPLAVQAPQAAQAAQPPQATQPQAAQLPQGIPTQLAELIQARLDAGESYEAIMARLGGK
jgi:hypothetical protein